MDEQRQRIPTADVIAETIWKMQDVSKREKDTLEGHLTINGLEYTKRLIRQSVSLGLVSLEQLRIKVKELWPDRPIRSHVSRIIDIAAGVRVPGIIELKRETELRLHVPMDDRPHSVDERDRIAREHGCDCAGRGIVSRKVPDVRYRSGGYEVAYRCKCPVGEAIKAVGDMHRPIADWERRYGSRSAAAMSSCE